MFQEDHHRKITTSKQEDTEVSNISQTKDTTDTTDSPVGLPSMSPESIFKPEHKNTKYSIALEDTQIPQNTKEELV